MVLTYAMYGISASWGSNWLSIAALVVATVVAFAIKVADQWDRAIVLRLGRFHVMRGPGLFLIVPIIDTIPYWIDIRVITSLFSAERTLTKDTVPVNVDAVLFWKVVDPIKAALDVADYRNAISWAAQTALRDVEDHVPVAAGKAANLEGERPLPSIARIRTASISDARGGNKPRCART